MCNNLLNITSKTKEALEQVPKNCSFYVIIVHCLSEEIIRLQSCEMLSISLQSIFIDIS